MKIINYDGTVYVVAHIVELDRWDDLGIVLIFSNGNRKIIYSDTEKQREERYNEILVALGGEVKKPKVEHPSKGLFEDLSKAAQFDTKPLAKKKTARAKKKVSKS